MHQLLQVLDSPRRLLAGVAALALASSAPAIPGEIAPYQTPPRIRSASPDAIVVENMRWGFEGLDRAAVRHRTVTIRPEKIKDVYYWSENFAPEWIAAHGMLAFVMEDDTGVVADDGSRDIGFVYSGEAARAPGDSYSLRRAFDRDAYGSVILLTSLRDRVAWATAMQDHSIDEFRLELDREQKVALVRKAIAHAARPRRGEGYHATTNSCITAVADALNMVLEDGRKLRKWAIPGVAVNLQLAIPKSTFRYMRRKGVATRVRSFRRGAGMLEYGPGLALDVAAAGADRPDPLAPLDEALHRMAGEVQAFHEVNERAQAMDDADPNYAAVLAELQEVGTAMQDRFGEIANLVLAAPELCIAHYLSLDPPDLPIVGILESNMRVVVQMAIRSGQIPSTPELEELLGRLGPGSSASVP